MSETPQERYKRIRDRYKYLSTKTLTNYATTEYIFIRDTQKELELMLQEQWIIISILQDRAHNANTKRRT